MRNLEIKCSYPDQRRAARLAREQLGAAYLGRLVQTDTYFPIRPGRLKLRHEQQAAPHRNATPESRFTLIHYRRPDRRSPKCSAYHLLAVDDGPRMLAFFTAALGVQGRVRKVRRLFVKDNIRVHLDTVRGLGKFLEFELLVSPSRPLAACEEQMGRLLALFGIAGKSLIRFSYADLLLGPRAR